MNIPETYDYLVRASRDLWATLERAPDERTFPSHHREKR